MTIGWMNDCVHFGGQPDYLQQEAPHDADAARWAVPQQAESLALPATGDAEE